jgi:ribosomal protein S18 acetylase RimI-like enzyme
MEPQVVLRPAAGTDVEFLRTLFASTRERELAALPGDADFRQKFIALQFDAQRRAYAANHPRADEHIIDVDGVAGGRLTVDRASDLIEILDISLLPGCRNRGIGTRLLEGLAVEAARRGAALGLRVVESNPAQRLYERLGFHAIGSDGVYRRLVREPPRSAGRHRAGAP